MLCFTFVESTDLLGGLISNSCTTRHFREIESDCSSYFLNGTWINSIKKCACLVSKMIGGSSFEQAHRCMCMVCA